MQIFLSNFNMERSKTTNNLSGMENNLKFELHVGCLNKFNSLQILEDSNRLTLPCVPSRNSSNRTPFFKSPEMDYEEDESATLLPPKDFSLYDKITKISHINVKSITDS